MAGSAAADEGGGAGGAPAVSNALADQIFQALAGIEAQQAALTERLASERAGIEAGHAALAERLAEEQVAMFDRIHMRLEDIEQRGGSTRPPSSDGYDSSDSYDSSGSDASCDDDGDHPRKQYLQVIASRNRHWGAAQREADRDQRPRRYSLYGYQYWDLLIRGKHQGGGTLGLTMEFSEPVCMYLQTALDAARECAKRADDLRVDGELRGTLHALSNTLSGTYGLANMLRTLIVERAKVTAPGATAGDKKRQQFVEQQLHEDDLGSPDVAPRVREIKAIYDVEASKQSLRKLASSGEASRAGSRRGGRRERERERDEPAKPSRSARRRARQRAQRERGEGSDGDAPKSAPRKPKEGRPSGGGGKPAADKDKSGKNGKTAGAADRGGSGGGHSKGQGGRGGSRRDAGGRGGGSRGGGRRARSDDSGSASEASGSGSSDEY